MTDIQKNAKSISTIKKNGSARWPKRRREGLKTYDEFEDESERCLGVDDVMQRHDVGVAQVAQQRCLTNRRERSPFFLL